MKIVEESFAFTQEKKSAVSLVEYCKYIGYSEFAFFGLTNTDDAGLPCIVVLAQRKRNLILAALVRAQSQIEENINYYLSPTWTYQESHWPAAPTHLSKCHVRALGVKSRVLVDSYAVDYGDLYNMDNLLESPVPVDIITDALFDTLSICYPISQAEIIPSSYEIISGGYRVFIPISRLATESMVDGKVYDARDLSSYQESIDVYSTTTISPSAVFVTADGQCGDTITDPDCAKIIHSELSIVRISKNICRLERSILINYLSYLDPDDVMKTAIIRLAHTFLEEEPCACDKVRYIWENDRFDSGDNNVAECPFGVMAGAVYAWKVARKSRVFRAVLL